MEWIVPIWVGIIANVTLSMFNVSRIGRPATNFDEWYFKRRGGAIILTTMWTVLLIISGVLLVSP